MLVLYFCQQRFVSLSLYPFAALNAYHHTVLSLYHHAAIAYFYGIQSKMAALKGDGSHCEIRVCSVVSSHSSHDLLYAVSIISSFLLYVNFTVLFFNVTLPSKF